jgi:hypothetical protein
MPEAVSLLGFIPHRDRTIEQEEAHERAEKVVLRFALPPVQLAKGEKVRLFDFWKHPDVVADVGLPFDRVHQQTGSCCWAGGTNALFSTIAAQRVADDNPTKAFLPFTMHNYLMSRYNLGLRTPGEGSAGSTFAQSLTLDGCRDWPNGIPDGLPDWTDTDGIEVKAADEYLWSSPVNNPYYKKVMADAKGNLLGSAGLCKDVGQLRSYVGNGYGVSFACDNFIGHAQVEGEGDEACVIGYWDQPGGHQQSVHAYWEHPRFGPLYWAQNNWPRSVYPRDPAGGPVCGCWVREAKVQSAIQNLHSEVYGLSHQKWIPARPKMLDWYA